MIGFQNDKKRHVFLSLWLALIIIYSVTGTFLYFGGATHVKYDESATDWAVPAFAGLLMLQTACAAALFKWKKWGFWGYCAVNATGLIVDIFIGVNLVWPSIAVVIAILGLYLALNVGTENKAWPQLE